MEYPKIETLYDRDPQTFKVIPGRLRLPEFNLVKRWLVTEKIDGTNVRIILRPTSEGLPLQPSAAVRYGGRTDDAQMPTFLLAMLQERFPPEVILAAFDPNTEAIIFGEGYGPKIQKSGGNYRKDVGFRVFDVVVFGANGRPWWLNWVGVKDVARKIGAEAVPVLPSAWGASILLDEALEFVSFTSIVANTEGSIQMLHEGIVARTDPLLFTRAGQRVMWKLKGRDF